MKFLQINLHNRKAAQDLMHQTARENAIDFIMASEYHKRGGPNWYLDSNNKAAIVNFQNAQLDCPGQEEPGFRWIAAKGRRIYSCYWSPSSTFPEYMDFLNRLESSIRASTTPVIIGGDFNAWHKAWGSSTTTAVETHYMT